MKKQWSTEHKGTSGNIYRRQEQHTERDGTDNVSV